MTKAKIAKNADAKALDGGNKKNGSKSKTPPKAEKKPAKAAAAPGKPAKAGRRDTERIVNRPEKTIKPPEQPKTAPPSSESGRFMFGSSGLGIKTSSKKPGLSVAPGVMILGRPVAARQDQAPRPSERRLSKKEQADIKNFLLERRERLLAGMRRELAMQKERAESKAADEVDKATDAYDEDLSFEIATANDQELEEIQVALEKIERGTYGECEICGCAISPSRLKILPSATTCVSCRGQEELARRRDDNGPNFMMSDDVEGEAEQM